MKQFGAETGYEIWRWLQSETTEVAPGDVIDFLVPNPDLGSGYYGGEQINGLRHRGYFDWVELASQVGCRMLTPIVKSSTMVQLRFQKCHSRESFHGDAIEDVTEKYGVASRFAAIDKTEESAFMISVSDALARVNLGADSSVLDIGVNRGDELGLLCKVYTNEMFEKMHMVGIDHCGSAIAAAKERFSKPNQEFHVHDVNHLEKLGLGRFDLLFSVGTLQSPGINFKERFMYLVQNHLKKGGSVILGFPNCRWMDGEVVYGAKAANYSYSEMSLLYKDVHFCKKYLQQHKYRVTLTGKYYVILTATYVGK